MLEGALLDGLIERVVAGYEPDAIGLFGSHAIGTATERSDVDLVVIKRTREVPHRRAAHVRRLIPRLFKIDVVVLTPDELREARHEVHTFHHTVSRQMKLVYVRPGLERRLLEE